MCDEEGDAAEQPWMSRELLVIVWVVKTKQWGGARDGATTSCFTSLLLR